MTKSTSLRVAIRAPNWLGDVVMALPAVRALSQTFADGHVAVYVRASLASLVTRAIPGVAVHALPASRSALFRQWPGRIRRQAFDVGVVLPPSFSAACLFRLGRTGRVFAHDGGVRRILVTDRVPRPERGMRHLSDEYGDVAACAASRAGRTLATPTWKELPVADHERAALRAFIPDPEPWIVLAPGAVYGDTKRWPIDYVARLAERLHERMGGSVLLTGAPTDRAQCAAVASRARVPVRNLAGDTSLDQLVALFASAALVVSNDSGAMHVADAVGAPLVALFGSTNPDWTGPRGPNSVVVRNRVPCSPCYARTCAIGIVCLTELDVETVYAACDERLSRSG